MFRFLFLGRCVWVACILVSQITVSSMELLFFPISIRQTPRTNLEKSFGQLATSSCWEFRLNDFKRLARCPGATRQIPKQNSHLFSVPSSANMTPSTAFWSVTSTSCKQPRNAMATPQKHHGDTTETPWRHHRNAMATPQKHHGDTAETPWRHHRNAMATPQKRLGDTAETPWRHRRNAIATPQKRHGDTTETPLQKRHGDHRNAMATPQKRPGDHRNAMATPQKRYCEQGADANKLCTTGMR